MDILDALFITDIKTIIIEYAAKTLLNHFFPHIWRTKYKKWHNTFSFYPSPKPLKCKVRNMNSVTKIVVIEDDIQVVVHYVDITEMPEVYAYYKKHFQLQLDVKDI